MLDGGQAALTLSVTLPVLTTPLLFVATSPHISHEYSQESYVA